jgi:hypothetical protein
MNYRPMSFCPHELPLRPKESIQLTILHLLSPSVSQTRYVRRSTGHVPVTLPANPFLFRNSPSIRLIKFYENQKQKQKQNNSKGKIYKLLSRHFRGFPLQLQSSNPLKESTLKSFNVLFMEERSNIRRAHLLVWSTCTSEDFLHWWKFRPLVLRLCELWGKIFLFNESINNG